VLDRPESEVVWLPLAIQCVFALLGCCYLFPPVTLPSISMSRARLNWLIMIAMGAAGAMVAIAHGFEFSVDFGDLYDRRFAARESIVGGTWLSYVVALFQRCLVPYALARGLAGRRWELIAVGLAGTAAAFVLACEKTLVFLPVAMCATMMCLHYLKRTFGIALIAGLALLVTLAMAECYFVGTDYLNGYGIQRVLVNPSHLTAYYWDYFSTQPHLYFRGTLGRLVGYQSGDYSAPYTIGWIYFGDTELNANANIWASAFAECGYIGMLGVTLLLGLGFRLVDGACQGNNVRLGCLCTICMALAWSEGALQTSLISAGVLPLFLLMSIHDSETATGLIPAKVLAGAECAARVRRQLNVGRTPSQDLVAKEGLAGGWEPSR
jgi:hypothetical protein